MEPLALTCKERQKPVKAGPTRPDRGGAFGRREQLVTIDAWPQGNDASLLEVRRLDRLARHP